MYKKGSRIVGIYVEMWRVIPCNKLPRGVVSNPRHPRLVKDENLYCSWGPGKFKIQLALRHIVVNSFSLELGAVFSLLQGVSVCMWVTVKKLFVCESHVCLTAPQPFRIRGATLRLTWLVTAVPVRR